LPIKDAVDFWYKELRDFKGPVSSFTLDSTGKSIGHFTQVIWAKSNIVACGASVCKDATNFPWIITIVCDYKPSGN
jgi:hypothetical protein